MRILIAAAALALALPASAADLNKPATLDQVMKSSGSNLAGCYFETSIAGTYLRADRDAQAGIGGGCDAILANLVIGGGIRADWGDIQNTGSIFAKLGISINNGATIYGVAEWNFRDLKPNESGQFSIGAGAELKLDIINNNLSGFAEWSRVVSKFGPVDKDSDRTRLGLRYRF